MQLEPLSPCRAAAVLKAIGGVSTSVFSYCIALISPLMEVDGPETKVVFAYCGYDSDHIRETPEEKGVAAVIPRIGTAKHKFRSMATSMSCVTALSTASISSKTCDAWRADTTSHLGFVQIAAVRLWTHFVTKA